MPNPQPRAVVFSPSPLLTVTVEEGADGNPDIHLHPGGQGVWIARMMASLGAQVELCAPFGGEPGNVLIGLIESTGVGVCASPATGSNGAYVHDRRAGDRKVIATANPAPLERHELDELINNSLVHGLDADIVVLGGPDGDAIVPVEAYERLARDLHGHGVMTVADLSGEPMAAALAGGVTVLKTSHNDLARDHATDTVDIAALSSVMRKLAADGAETVIVTRATEPSLVLYDDTMLEVRSPTFTAVDERGAGDSLTAGTAVGLARGKSIQHALKLGAAAGALNAMRHGLGSGQREPIERLAKQVHVARL